MLNTPGLERFVGGLLLMLAAVGLCVGSWQLYRIGQPGAPLFADDRVDYGRDSAATLFLPALSPVERVSTAVRFAEVPDGVRQEIAMTLERAATAPQDLTVPAILILRDGARMQAISEASNDSYQGRRMGLRKTRTGEQYMALEFHLPAGAPTDTARVAGRMIVPALTRDNSRTSFVSPLFGDVRKCASSVFQAPVDRTPEDLDLLVGRLLSPFHCLDQRTVRERIADSAKSAVSISVAGSTRAATRIDYASPSPSEDANAVLQFRSEEARNGFRARASYVDLNGEARDQRLLFISGIAIGLASAIVPSALPLMWGGGREWRAARRSTDETDEE
jgi:hypothetical protein